MAKYDIMHSCGHIEQRDIGGKVKDRNRKAEYLARGLCPNCWKLEQERQITEANTRAAKAAAEVNLPALIGSEKQRTWANSIRMSAYNAILKAAEKLSADGKPLYKEPEKIARGLVSIPLRAVWWIDNRFASTFAEWGNDIRRDFLAETEAFVAELTGKDYADTPPAELPQTPCDEDTM